MSEIFKKMNEYISSKISWIRCSNVKWSFMCAYILIILEYIPIDRWKTINYSHIAILLNWIFPSNRHSIAQGFDLFLIEVKYKKNYYVDWHRNRPSSKIFYPIQIRNHITFTVLPNILQKLLSSNMQVQ